MPAPLGSPSADHALLDAELLDGNCLEVDRPQTVTSIRQTNETHACEIERRTCGQHYGRFDLVYPRRSASCGRHAVATLFDDERHPFVQANAYDRRAASLRQEPGEKSQQPTLTGAFREVAVHQSAVELRLGEARIAEADV